MKPLLSQHGGYCPVIAISALLSLCSSTTLSAVAHYNKEVLHIPHAPFLSKSAPLSFVKLILLKLYSLTCLYIVFSATQIIKDISLIVKPSSNKFSNVYFGMLNLRAPDYLAKICGVYLPYLEQYT